MTKLLGSQLPRKLFSRSVVSLATSWMVLQSVFVASPSLAKNDSQLPCQKDDKQLCYNQFLEKIEQGTIDKVIIDTRKNTATVTLPNQKTKQVHLWEQQGQLIRQLRDNNIPVDVGTSNNSARQFGIIANVVLIVVLVAGLALIIRRSAKNSGQTMNFSKSRARYHVEAKTGISFDDVAGIDEAKEELQEVVSFLKETERFTAVGAKVPKGMLMVGSPGTGKTLLAKAVAGEAGVPFYSLSGSEFVEMFVGVGASRVRDLFKKAKENAPCLVFIDEIDAVGRKRGAGIGGGNDEREQTLNQLLTELDGFEENTGIIVIAATNRPDVLDPALMRPGRFDRQVRVDLPSYNGRLQILQVHAKDKKLAPEVSLEAVARKTPGLAGADLANLLNEAAILTVRRLKPMITPLDIDDALDRITIGLTLNPLLDSKKKRLIAYHETGHALLMTLLEHSDPLNKVTIIPRSGGVGGFAQQSFDEDMVDSGLYSRAWLIDRITITLGGRAAEMEIFGDAEVTAGAQNDLKVVSNLAREMVTHYGMSDLGPLALESEDHNSEDVFLGGGDMKNRNGYSEEVATKIDEQVRAIAFSCYERARKIIRENRDLMDHIVDILLYEETIEGEDFRKIVSQYTQLPEKQIAMSGKK